MCPNVSLQQPRSRKALPAVLTLATLVVSPDVHGKRGHAHVELVAVWTPPGLLVSRTPVGLPVSGQVAGSAVLFPAVIALVLVVLGRLLTRAGRQVVLDGTSAAVRVAVAGIQRSGVQTLKTTTISPGLKTDLRWVRTFVR